ncbi:MAG: Uncharacterised protein [Flavobacteriia bacterium]|nr:MAG: Uncharacterised protein [Flavobacteriia bacterium]
MIERILSKMPKLMGCKKFIEKREKRSLQKFSLGLQKSARSDSKTETKWWKTLFIVCFFLQYFLFSWSFHAHCEVNAKA